MSDLLLPGLCVLLAAFVSGCHGSEAVTVDPGPSAENYRSDTTRIMPAPTLKPAGAGRLALPSLVEEYEAMDVPAFLVSEISISRDSVTVTSPTERRTFRAPARGEQLRIQKELAGPRDTAGRVVGRVEGQPTPRTVEVQRPKEKASLWAKLLRLPAWAVGALLGLALVVVLVAIRLFK